jgi:hypothetical protein
MRQDAPSYTQPEEKIYLRDLFRKCPILVIILFFLAALTFGGALGTGLAVFTILALVGGFTLPMMYGVRIGLAPHESVILCLGIFTFISYSSLSILVSLEKYSSAERYLRILKKRFRPVYRFLTVRAGRLGTFGILTLTTFLVGWWLAVILAFIAVLEIPYAMTGIFVGLAGGGLLAWGLYFGIGRVFSNPLVLGGILVGIGLATGTISQVIIARMRRRRKVSKKRGNERRLIFFRAVRLIPSTESIQPWTETSTKGLTL